jgi:hypothetical protein
VFAENLSRLVTDSPEIGNPMGNPIGTQNQIWAIRKSGVSDSGKPRQVLSIWISRWQRVESEYQSSRTSQSQSSQLADWQAGEHGTSLMDPPEVWLWQVPTP